MVAKTLKRTPLEDLQDICETIQERWDSDQRSGKLLLALMGHIPNYDARVTRLRDLLAQHSEDGGEDAQSST